MGPHTERRAGRTCLQACAAALIALVGVVAAPAPADAYRKLGHRFAGPLTYHTTMPAHRGAVRAAAQAWNRSGVRISLKEVSRSRAKVLVVPYNLPCGGDARIASGRLLRASRMRLAKSGRECTDRYSMTIVAAHEFGHILGLNHEDRRCATMNTSAGRTGGAGCSLDRPWEWRCRILEPDDVRGAVAIYGGRARKARSPAGCPLYSAAPPVTGLAAAADEFGTVKISFRRGPNASLPSFLGGFGWSWKAVVAKNACRSDASQNGPSPNYAWTVGVGGIQTDEQYVDSVPGARYCVTVVSIDAASRPSAPASVWVEVPAPAPDEEPPPF